jgi:hypothetical protein
MKVNSMVRLVYDIIGIIVGILYNFIFYMKESELFNG